MALKQMVDQLHTHVQQSKDIHDQLSKNPSPVKNRLEIV